MSTGIIEDICANCRYWRRFSWDWKPHDRTPPTEGHCRRYPPVKQGKATEYTVKVSDTCDFPVTTKDEWCGEFVRKPLLEIAEDKP